MAVVHIYEEGTGARIDLARPECLEMELKLNLSPLNKDGAYNALGDLLYNSYIDNRTRLYHADAAVFAHVSDLRKITH